MKPFLLAIIVVLAAPAQAATLQAAFSINAQVPPVARVSQPFSFQFSSATFSGGDGSSLTYAVNNAPAWIQVDSKTRTLYGTPQSGDLGSFTIDLVADDGDNNATMHSTLVVVDERSPGSGNVTTALAQAGPLSDLDTLSLHTGSSFDVTFGQDIFSSVANPYFYATSSDHSPLPAWVQFDSSALVFSGSAPSSLSAPQTYGINLYISTIQGFSEASVTFKLAVGSHQLYFAATDYTANFSSNTPFVYNELSTALLLDNQTAGTQELTSITYQGPSWMSFDNETLELAGTPPSGTTAEDVTIVAQDIYGNVATTHIYLGQASSDSFFIGDIGVLNATIGEYFSYTLPRSNITIPAYSVRVGLAANEYDSWLTFDTFNLTLHAKVPTDASTGIIFANFTITSNTTQEAQTFDFEVQLFESTTGGQSGRNSGNGNHSKRLSAGAAAAIGIICGLFALLLVAALAYCIWRAMGVERGRKQQPRRPWISRPILTGGRWNGDTDHVEPDVTVGLAGMQGDDSMISPSAASSRYRARKKHERARSEPTYLEPADVDAITAINRTSLGTSALDDNNGHNPHDAMKVPTVMARQGLSRMRARGAPIRSWAKRSFRLKRLRPERNSQYDDLDNATPSLSSSSRASAIGEDPQLKAATHDMGESYHHLQIPGIPPSISRTPGMRARNRKTLRLVTPAPQSSLPSLRPLPKRTLADDRPVSDKRASYIRTRATARNINGLGNPLFAARGAYDGEGDRGRRSRLLEKRQGHRVKPSRSRSSSIGLRYSLNVQNLLKTDGEGSNWAGHEGRTEDWTTTQGSALNFRYHLDESGAPSHKESEENLETGFQNFLNEEVQRQGKRQKWRDRLNRDSKGQLKEAMPETSEGDSRRLAEYIAQESEPSRESRKRRTQSWIRNALTPVISNRLSLRLSRQSTKRSEGHGRASWISFDGGSGWNSHSQDALPGWNAEAEYTAEQGIDVGGNMGRSGHGEMLELPAFGGDRRFASAATQASSTRAFL